MAVQPRRSSNRVYEEEMMVTEEIKKVRRSIEDDGYQLNIFIDTNK